MAEQNLAMSTNTEAVEWVKPGLRVKLGLFNAKIRNENRRYIHRLIY